MADLTTLLSYFLTDLYAGTLGVKLPITAVRLGDGSAAAPSLTFASETNSGWYRQGSGDIRLVIGGAPAFIAQSSSSVILSQNTSTLSFGAAADLAITRDAANTLAQKNGNADQLGRSYAMNGGYWERGSVSELLTLSTGGATTDTTANLLPANAIIEAVIARVTTTITTATDWKLGDATIAGRFTAAQSAGQLTAGATIVGLVHIDLTGTSGPRQTAAAKLRVTTTGTPGAGAIRITVFYRSFTPATS